MPTRRRWQCCALGEARLRVVQSTFVDFAFAADGYDLISAQLALPFNPPERFGAMFARLVGALRPGAIFAGDFFGVRDGWNTPGTAMGFHRAAEVKRFSAAAGVARGGSGGPPRERRTAPCPCLSGHRPAGTAA